MSGLSRRSLSRSSAGSKGGWSAAPSLSLAMWIALVSALLALACALGWGSRAVFIPDQSPMRIGEPTRMRVWMMVDGQWTLSANRVEIPEGYYILSPRWVDEDGEEPKQ